MSDTKGSSTRQVYLVYLLVVMYALCYQLQAPIEPFLVDRLVGKGETDSATSYARLQSFFSFTQTIGSVTIGYLLDKISIRLGFIINFAACTIVYYVLSITNSIEMLWFSKVPGLAMSGFLCAQVAVTRMTNPGSDRITALGRLTTAYTIGGIAGPYLGGWLGSQGDYYLGAKLAAGGSVLAAILSLCFLPADNNSSDKTGEPSAEKTKTSSQPFATRVKQVLSLAGTWLLVKVVSGLANSMIGAAEPLILKNHLKFTEADLGTFMSSKFAFGGIANGFLLEPFTAALKARAAGEGAPVANCLCLMWISHAAKALLYSSHTSLLPAEGLARQTPFIAITLLASVVQFALGTMITADTTTLVPDEAKGTLIGIEHALFSTARVFGPALGVAIFNSSNGLSKLSLACGGIYLAIHGLWSLSMARSKGKVE